MSQWHYLQTKSRCGARNPPFQFLMPTSLVFCNEKPGMSNNLLHRMERTSYYFKGKSSVLLSKMQWIIAAVQLERERSTIQHL